MSDSENVTQNSDAIREKRLANLKPFQPGQSGNPGGRPKTTPISDMLRRIFEQDVETAELAIREVLSGKSAMARVLLLEKAADRLEGKVVQKIDAELHVGLSARVKKALELVGDE